jgi:hypothetical protein
VYLNKSIYIFSKENIIMIISDELKQILLDLSIKEFNEKSWGVTEAYLKVMEIETHNGIPKIAKIETETDNRIAIYFSVKGEDFYYTHWFTIEPKIELTGIDITAGNSVNLILTSETLAKETILSMISFIPQNAWQKGEVYMINGRSVPNRINKDSGLRFELDNNKAGDFENKILQMLVELEKHEQELFILQKDCSMYISTAWHSYNGNTCLGGFTLDNKVIERLNKLKLEIDFDLYTGGNPLLDE